jgi:putative effector of murein hydrolase LrgA (UPF0299 family)
MIQALTLILLCQLAGEVAVQSAGLSIPGPVVGLLLLLAWLSLRGGVSEGLERTSSALLGNLSLLFVPAGVGVVTYLGVIRDMWLPLSVALVGSTLVTLAVTALVMIAARRLVGGARGGNDGG